MVATEEEDLEMVVMEVVALGAEVLVAEGPEAVDLEMVALEVADLDMGAVSKLKYRLNYVY